MVDITSTLKNVMDHFLRDQLGLELSNVLGLFAFVFGTEDYPPVSGLATGTDMIHLMHKSNTSSFISPASGFSYNIRLRLSIAWATYSSIENRILL